jgi:hypothetical protein
MIFSLLSLATLFDVDSSGNKRDDFKKIGQNLIYKILPQNTRVSNGARTHDPQPDALTN